MTQLHKLLETLITVVMEQNYIIQHKIGFHKLFNLTVLVRYYMNGQVDQSKSLNFFLWG